jgi:Outer membrane protein beta-barrel domain
MTKPLLTLSLGSAILLGASLAAAQPAQGNNANCPPGSWFCADTQAAPAAPAGQPVQPLQQLPAGQGNPPTVQYQPAPAQPPVVVYQPPPPVMVVQPAHPEQPPPVYVYTPREAYPRRNEWGLTLHLEGALLGGGRAHDAGMGGLGFGLRYKPIPHLGVEADLDFVGGRDYNGYRRGETAFTINGLLFVNPKSRAQVYFLGGFGWAGATATDDSPGYDQATYRYGYFGGQLGVGLEWRISKHFALNADIRGFIRGRVDDNTHYHPEFYDPATGKSTNTSGGGLITGGMTFYF